MSSADISVSCQLLKELGFIETETWDDKRGTYHYPVRITAEGMKFLSEANKTFWELAEKVAIDALKNWTGVKFDIPSMVEFFKTAIRKYKQERASDV